MSDSDWSEVNDLPCGCQEKIKRDVADKVVGQELNHCIAHALSWAGKMLKHAGERLLAETQKPQHDFGAVFQHATTGKRLWAEEKYSLPVVLQAGDSVVQDEQKYTVLDVRKDGDVMTFYLEEEK